MDEKEFDNVYAVPANYTDSGKLFGGMLETRNTVEAVLLLAVIGYPELMIPMDIAMKIVVMTVTLVPIGIISLMGIGGDSLGQYLTHVFMFLSRKRKMTYRRFTHAQAEAGGKRRKNSKKKAG